MDDCVLCGIVYVVIVSVVPFSLICVVLFCRGGSLVCGSLVRMVSFCGCRGLIYRGSA